MRVLIIEDEQISAHLLEDILTEEYPDLEVIERLHSVQGTMDWFDENEEPDLIFMDIQLSDGLSFDVIKNLDLRTPIIFTTAYDQYALKAFKVNSLDYILKPIDRKELSAAIAKYKELHGKKVSYDSKVIEELIKSLSKPSYKERFMVKSGQNLGYVLVTEVLFAFADEGLVFLITNDGKKHHIDHKIEELQNLLDPKNFFRVNRKFIVNINAIQKIHTWHNSRLKLDLMRGDEHEIIVSRERVSDFKNWLGQ